MQYCDSFMIFLLYFGGGKSATNYIDQMAAFFFSRDALNSYKVLHCN